MTPRSIRWRNSWAAWVAAAALCAVAPAAGFAAAGPTLEVEDPRSGAAVRVQAGAPLLHVVFTAAWCSPCLDELRDLADLEARWHEEGYRLVLVAVQTRHTRERLVRFADERSLPGQFLFDADGGAAASLGAAQLPLHMLFDESGKEVLRAERFDDGVAETVSRLLGARARERGR